jgi:hypothetical protein
LLSSTIDDQYGQHQPNGRNQKCPDARIVKCPDSNARTHEERH